MWWSWSGGLILLRVVVPFSGPVADRDGRLRVRPGTTPSRAEIDAMDDLVGGMVGRSLLVLGETVDPQNPRQI